MSKGGGGGVDTSGMEAATAKQIALQKEIYEQTREDVQPWYKMGVGATGRLSDLLGVSGGSVQNRDQIYNSLLPQYTSQTSGGGYGGVPFELRNFDFDRFREDHPNVNMGHTGVRRGDATTDQIAEFIMGFKDGAGSYPGAEGRKYNQKTYDSLMRNYKSDTPYQATRDVIDYEGLNAEVDRRLGEQGTPEDYGSLLEKFSMDDFEQDPGYQFRKDEANKALERQMAAQGITLGGAGLGDVNPQAYRAMSELNQGLASQEYGASRGRYVQDQLNTFNMLMGAAGMGQGSTGTMAGAGQNYSVGAGNAMTDLAGAQMNAQLAQQSQSGGMFSDILGFAGQVAPLFLSDRSLKENIKAIGKENGFNTYEFNYTGDPHKYIGVMADEVKEIMPEAVYNIDGFDAVDYNMIGVKMRAA